MKYISEIRAACRDPRSLEKLYQTAQRQNEAAEFAADMFACYQESPDNILYGAWYYRLQAEPAVVRRADEGIHWKLAIPLSIFAGLLLWLLSDPRLLFPNQTPFLALAWAPIEACFVIVFLTLAARKSFKQAWPILLGLLGFLLYASVFTWFPSHTQYPTLAMLHLPLLAWIGVGLYVLGLRSHYTDRFAFLVKAIEAFITMGIFAAAGGVFASITYGLFEALGILLSDTAIRLLAVGGGGAIPVLAVAIVYHPQLSPTAQRFDQGLSKLISTLMRLLLPLTLLVLLIYLCVIPFNFMAPFRSREVLIVYNAMLFAIMGLFIGATPVLDSNPPLEHEKALRMGILALAILAVLVSVYALSATIYRTVQDMITPNRLTVIGWNSINIGIMALMIYQQFRKGPERWNRSIQRAIGTGAIAYIIWTVFLILALPMLFR
ncbi:MAG: hypothetical protein H5T68_03165 [Chloroflexi bacterium]|nr:hypothetical protein [Chloroflexota bacterium]